MSGTGRRVRRFAGSTALDLALILAASMFAWGALLAPTYFLQAHDARHSVFFLLEFDKAFSDGALYPRWGIDFALGYGYPLFSYYSPVAYYLAEAFHLLGAGLTDAVKITYVISTIGSGWAMYGFVRRLFGRRAGVLAAVVYMFAPYHLVDVYVRSSFAEHVAYVFLPLTFWAFHNLMEEPGLTQVALAALAYAGLILTHDATFMIATPLLMAYCAYLLVRRAGTPPGEVRRPRNERAMIGAATSTLLKRAAGAGGAAILAFALSAVLLFPVLLERDFIAQSQWTQGSFDYVKHFTFLGQLLSPFWGYGYAGGGVKNDMSLQLGIVAVILAVLSAAWQPRGRRRGQWAFFLLASLALVALMTPLSQPLWQALPLVSLVQFPWRLLLPATLTLSVTAGALVSTTDINLPDTLSRALGGEATDAGVVAGVRGFHPGRGYGSLAWVLCLVAVLAAQSYAVPQYTPLDPRSETEKAIVDFETFYPPDRVGTTAWVQKQPTTSPLVAEYLADRPLTRAHLLSGAGEVHTTLSAGRSIEAAVNTPAGATAQFYVYYFPGWEARIDGQPVAIRPEGPQALLTLDVPAGDHRLLLRFIDTPMGQWGQIVSLASLVATAALAVLGRRRGA
jgi:hypothetical protein